MFHAVADSIWLWSHKAVSFAHEDDDGSDVFLILRLAA